MNNTLQFILRQFAGATVGHVTLAAGSHTVQVETEQPVSLVLTGVEQGELPVCGGDLTTATALVNPDGFELVASVRTDSAVIWWVAF